MYCLLAGLKKKKFPTFEILKLESQKNPIFFFIFIFQEHLLLSPSAILILQNSMKDYF